MNNLFGCHILFSIESLKYVARVCLKNMCFSIKFYISECQAGVDDCWNMLSGCCTRVLSETLSVLCLRVLTHRFVVYEVSSKYAERW